MKREHDDIKLILDRWERGDSLTADEIRFVETAGEEPDIAPGVRGMLSLVKRDAIGPEPPVERGFDRRAVENIMSGIPAKQRFADRGERFFRGALGVGVAAAGLALLVAATALLLRIVAGVPTGTAIAAQDIGAPFATEVASRNLEETGESLVVAFELYAPEAGSVALVGDFNDWDAQRHLLKDSGGTGSWRVEITVKPGQVYTYNFLIDGEEWIPDPRALRQISDPFGGQKSVLSL